MVIFTNKFFLSLNLLVYICKDINDPNDAHIWHIVETAVTLLQTAHLPHKFWFHACDTSIYLINRLPCQLLRLKSPFFLLYGSSPVIHHLRIFGCACFPLLRPYNSNKLQPKTSTCIFLGYAGQYKGYICFSLHTNRIFVSRHVLFDESLFPYISVSIAALSPSLPLSAVSPSSPSVSLHNSVLPLVSSSPSFFFYSFYLLTFFVPWSVFTVLIWLALPCPFSSPRGSWLPPWATLCSSASLPHESSSHDYQV